MRFALENASPTQKQQLAGAFEGLQRQLDTVTGHLRQSEEEGRALETILTMLTERAEDPERREIERHLADQMQVAQAAKAYTRFKDFLILSQRAAMRPELSAAPRDGPV